ncbi:hypothetical protein QYZ88_007715 [Lachnospiraceae bacterium C1.1]|nr:hypothetical protein [Lachnospiraceae bacterium C1.1]
MINIDNSKVKEVIHSMHEAMQRKIKRGSRIKEDIVVENRIFSLLCRDFDIEPTKTAILMNETYGCDLTGDEVIQIFRNRRMANPNERKELLQWADGVVEQFASAIQGKREAFDCFEKQRKEPALRNGKRHDSQERIAAIMIYERYPEIDLFNEVDSLHLLGNTLARYYFYDIADAICDAYGFPQYHDTKKRQQSKDTVSKLSYEQALRRVEQLENTLDRTNTMLQDLQDEFAEQLEASKVKELADFFARLNSEKYGCILDELLVVRKGVDELRKSNYELPIEINGLLIMVKKLIQFVRDSHIEPIMRINSIREVIASDVEFCNYEGTPFSSPDEKKTVEVVSPGWVYKDKEVQISRPKVKEKNNG